MVVAFAWSADLATVDENSVGHLPIAEQEKSRQIAIANLRLLNCWLGIATKETIGNTFCVDCEYLRDCKTLYRYFDGTSGIHPSARARIVMSVHNIESDYL